MSIAAHEIKKQQVSEVKKKLEDAKVSVLFDYRGLTVAEVSDLRNEFRKEDIEYKVIKNNLVERAADDLGLDALKEYLVGPTAIAFSYEDPVKPAKILNEFIKKVKKTQIKAAVLEGTVLNESGVKALAELPSKEVLIAKLLGTMNAPIAGMVGVLSGTLRSLLYTLNAVQEKKQA